MVVVVSRTFPEPNLTKAFIMRFLSAILSCALLCSAVYADPPSTTKDVPSVANEEINRRGHDVEELGTIQDGPDAGVRRAMAPPADDSDKWFINFVGAGSTSTDQEKAATKLLLDDIKALKFSQYVKPDDSANSWGHWQEYRIDDALQQDWFAEIKPKLKIVGLPAIVIQPPANGKFGPNRTPVCVVGKYDGNPAKFSELIRVRVEAYIHKHGYDGTLATAKLVPLHHAQGSDDPIGARPPFDLPEPVAYPDAKDLPKLTMTFEQIRKKFPDLPAQDAAHYAEQQLTEQEIRDEELKLSKQPVEVDKTPANPTRGGSAGGEILIVGVLGIIAIGGAWYLQQRVRGQVDPTGNTIVSSTNASGST